jgi:hypothetical protein
MLFRIISSVFDLFFSLEVYILSSIWEGTMIDTQMQLTMVTTDGNLEKRSQVQNCLLKSRGE